MTDAIRDPVERLLREDARRAIPDDGFCLRVESTLPAPSRTGAWLRPALLLSSAALGGALAWLLAPAGTSLVQGFLDLARLQSQTPSALAAVGMALAMATCAAVLVAEEN
jgi:hypothetical protein